MDNLIELLTYSKSVGPIKYKKRTLYLEDQIPIINGDQFLVIIERIKNKKNILQGFNIYLQNNKNGKLYPDCKKKGYDGEVYIPEDQNDFRRNTVLTYRGEPNVLHIRNACEVQRPEFGYTTEYLFGGGATSMIIEKLSGCVRRYRCNDWETDDDFDDIIFRIERTNKADGQFVRESQVLKKKRE